MFQAKHAALPEASHDEFAREEFCGTLRSVFTTELWPANREIYDQQLPRYIKQHGHEPRNFREAREMMNSTFYWRGSQLVGRAAQELLWDTVGESVERQLDQLNAKAAKPARKPLGSLRLNPALKMPKYIEAVDIHAMPGNFHTELCEGDVYAGALYDRGVYVFSFGGLGPYNAGLGTTMSGFIKQQFPKFKPQKILDIGSGPGFTTTAFVDAFPKAEVHALDVGAPQVRYGHLRAESLGKRVHFSQQDGTHTDYPDASFDLVYSCLVTHECPVPVIKAMFRECHRLLKPGGMMIHDGMSPKPRDTGTQLMTSFFGHNVNEPFSVGMMELDYRKAFTQAGFPEDAFFEGVCPPAYLKEQLKFVSYVGAFKK
jgi:SAM-dependent methyltransferase